MSDWFAQLPRDWGVTRLKNVVESAQAGIWGEEPRGDDDDIRCVRVADFDRPRFAVGPVDTVRSVPAKDREARLLQSGDLLLEKSGGTDANPVGFTVMFSGDYEAVSSNFISRLRLRELQSPRFWLYAMAASYSTKRTERSVKRTTGIQNLDQMSFLNEVFPVPPPAAQTAIADYLDRETARIDTLIEEQQRVIEMLHERRGSLVARTLLLGLDGGVTLRHSGDAQLGDVPAHWRVVPTRYLCTITTGGEDSGNATEDGEYPFFVRGREILRIGHYSFDCEAVMTPGDGQGGTGKVFHYMDGKFEAHQRVYVFKISTAFLAGTSTTSCRRFLVRCTGGKQYRHDGVTTSASPRGVSRGCPPPRRTAPHRAYLDEQTAKIDALIAETERFIELARERRSALITAAVTGQIDVREVA